MSDYSLFSQEFIVLHQSLIQLADTPDIEVYFDGTFIRTKGYAMSLNFSAGTDKASVVQDIYRDEDVIGKDIRTVCPVHTYSVDGGLYKQVNQINVLWSKLYPVPIPSDRAAQALFKRFLDYVYVNPLPNIKPLSQTY